MLDKFRTMLAARRDRLNVYSAPDFWNGKARDYRGTAVSMFVNQNLNTLLQNDQFRFFDQALGNVTGQAILDIGCGTGRLSRHLARRGAHVTARDFAAEAVAIAKRESEGLPIDYQVQSVFEIQDDAAFDLIVVLGCLTVACQDSDQFRDVIGRAARALRPGGKLVIVEPFHAGRLSRVLTLSPDAAQSVLENAGFAIEARTEMHFWPARLPLSYIEWPYVLTAPVYRVGEWILRALPSRLGLQDYTGFVARLPS